MANTPWYDYPSDSPGGGGYGQIAEPLDPSYLKPDTNIQVPSGTPITAFASGVITDVSNRGYSGGGLSVTEKLTSAINSLAQYVSFNYLGGASVSKGQQVTSGQQLGTAGSPTGINFALALGSNPVWSGASGPLLNPQTQVLNELKGGQPLTTTTNNNGCQTGQVPLPWGGCWDVPIATGAAQSAQQWSQTAANVQQASTNLIKPDFWMRVGIGIAAVVLVLFGLHAFISNTGAAHKAEEISQDAPEPPGIGDLAKELNKRKQSNQQQQEPTRPQPVPNPAEGAGEAGAGATAGASTEAVEVLAV